jgi:hypothetical protein
MKKQIVRVSPLQSAKVMAALYFVMSIPFVLFMLAMPMPAGSMPTWVVIAMPLFYIVFGFLFSLLGAWIYNLVAGVVGGFEYTTREVAGGDIAN